MEPFRYEVRPARRHRLVITIALSVLVHGGMVVLGGIWPAQVPQPRMEVSTPEPGGIIEVPIEEPVPAGRTVVPPEMLPVPPETPEVESVLSDVRMPVMEEPRTQATPPPTPRNVAVRNSRAASPSSQAVRRTDFRDQGAPSNGAGIPGPGGRSGQGWSTQKPPYPYAARASHVQGSTVVRVTTDASGRVAEVVIVKSTGNALLDANTQTHVRSFWKGPPNATRTTEFVYQLR